MKVLIQHAVTHLYFKDFESWVKDETHARSFNGSLSAIDFCLEHRIDEVLIVLKFGDPQYDIQLRPFVGKRYAGPVVRTNPAKETTPGQSVPGLTPER